MALCTHGFSIGDVKFLIKLLNERYNEHFVLSFDTNKDSQKRYPKITAGNKATRKLLEDIDECFPLERKSNLWRDKDVYFYENKPNARVSISEYKIRRNIELLEFIRNNDQFMYKDVAKSLNWYATRFGVKEPSVVTIKNYLQPYVDFGVLTKKNVHVNSHNNIIFYVNHNLIEDFLIQDCKMELQKLALKNRPIK